MRGTIWYSFNFFSKIRIKLWPITSDMSVHLCCRSVSMGFHSMKNASRQKTSRWIRNIKNKSNRFDRRFLWMSLTVFCSLCLSMFVCLRLRLFCFYFDAVLRYYLGSFAHFCRGHPWIYVCMAWSRVYRLKRKRERAREKTSKNCLTIQTAEQTEPKTVEKKHSENVNKKQKTTTKKKKPTPTEKERAHTCALSYLFELSWVCGPHRFSSERFFYSLAVSVHLFACKACELNEIVLMLIMKIHLFGEINLVILPSVFSTSTCWALDSGAHN